MVVKRSLVAVAAPALAFAAGCGVPESVHSVLPTDARVQCVDVHNQETFLEPAAYFSKTTDLAYDRKPGLRGDLWLPLDRPTPYPAILNIHGGGWSGGHKNLRNARLWGEFFACRGIAFYDIDYDLGPENPAPGQARQAKCALRWLKGEGARYGIDAERIGVMGGSAGGHLTGLVATTQDIADFDPECTTHPEQDLTLQAALPVYGIFDFLTLQQQRIQLGSGYAEDIIGKEEATVEDWRWMSPISYVSADDPPFLFIQGRGDALVPWQQAVEMAGALDAVGVASEVVLVDAGEHGFDAFFSSPDMKIVLERVAAFVDSVLLETSR